MTITFVQQSSLVVTSPPSSTIDTTALTGVATGNCLVVLGSVFKGNPDLAITGISDGTDYVVRSSESGDGSNWKQIDFVAYLVNAASGSHTATVSISGGIGDLWAVIGMAEFRGVATTTPEDTFDGNNYQSAESDVNAGPITTTDSGALIIGSAGVSQIDASSMAWGSPASWTNLFRQNDGYTTGTAHDSGFWLPGSMQTSYTPQWSHRNFVSQGSAVVVALKAAAGGALIPRLSLLGVG